jgi:hypothetical protein
MPSAGRLEVGLGACSRLLSGELCRSHLVAAVDAHVNVTPFFSVRSVVPA